jgi:hypothetical protein
MKPKQEPLTIIEARNEFAKVERAFNAYIEKTKHLGKVAILLAEFGDNGYIRTQDPDVPWVPLLYGAANLMDREGFSPEEVKETFDSFIEMVVLKQGDGHEPPSPTHPFELMRAVMVATIDELMPCLRPMREFDAVVARAGGEDALKMVLVTAFHGALLKVLNDTQAARQ